MKLALLIILLSFNLISQVKQSDFALLESTPGWVILQIEKPEFKKGYQVSYRLNPFYIRGDFNGDGKQDIAVLITNRRNGKTGIAIFHNGDTSNYIIGAGKKYDKYSDNYNWIDVWSIGENDNSANGLRKPELIEVRKSESGGGIIRWNGRKYIWEPFAD